MSSVIYGTIRHCAGQSLFKVHENRGFFTFCFFSELRLTITYFPYHHVSICESCLSPLHLCHAKWLKQYHHVVRLFVCISAQRARYVCLLIDVVMSTLPCISLRPTYEGHPKQTMPIIQIRESPFTEMNDASVWLLYSGGHDIVTPGHHRIRQRCSGLVSDLLSASRPVPSRQNRLQRRSRR